MAVTWTALAILGAFALGALALLAMQSTRFDAVNQRFDAVNQRIDEAVRELRSEIRALGDRLERRISAHEARHNT